MRHRPIPRMPGTVSPANMRRRKSGRPDAPVPGGRRGTAHNWSLVYADVEADERDPVSFPCARPWASARLACAVNAPVGVPVSSVGIRLLLW